MNQENRKPRMIKVELTDEEKRFLENFQEGYRVYNFYYGNELKGERLRRK